MLTLKKFPKRSPNWVIRGTVNGTRVTETTGTPDKAAAEAVLARRLAELMSGTPASSTPSTTFSVAARAYVAAGGEGRFLDRLIEELGDKPVADIRQADVDELAAKLYPGAKASTVNRQCISPIITVITSAVDAELPGAILRRIKRRREQKPVITPASDDHIEKLAPHLSEGLRALITLMSFTGLRTGEALRVLQNDIQDGYAVVGRTKNGEPRLVPVPEGWIYPEGGFGYNTTQGVGRALQRAHKAAGLPYRDGHELGRHAFAARWLKAGKSLKGLQLAGGWKSLRVCEQVYGHLEITDIHEQMRELSRRR